MSGFEDRLEGNRLARERGFEKRFFGAFLDREKANFYLTATLALFFSEC
jgi:hypothetical protein